MSANLNKKISELPVADAITGSEYVELVQNGINVKATTAEVAFPGSASGIAPADADFLVKTANSTLSAERVVTDTPSVSWDWATAGQAKANVTAGATSGLAPSTADFLVRTADSALSAERVVTDTPSVTWDWGTAGQAKANVAAGTTSGLAPATADFLVKTGTSDLSAERVVDDSSTVVADWSVAGRVTFNVAGAGLPTVPVDYKDSVIVATTANITLSGEQTIDGVLTSASRVLVKNQNTGSQNGIYVSDAGAWTRSTDADTSAEVTTGMIVPVEQGTVSAGLLYQLTTTGTITLGTTALTFSPVAIPTSTFVYKAITGTTYTHVLLDSQRWLDATNASTKTVTIAPQSSVNSALNTEMWLYNSGAGLLTIAAGAGVTIRSSASILTLPQGYGCLIKKTANPNTWTIAFIYDSATLKSNVSSNLTKGFTGTAYNIGTVSTGTTTPDPANGNLQRMVNGGASTLAPPSVGSGDSCQITIQLTNNGSAGTLTTSGFTKVTGSSLTTTNGDDFMLYLTRINGFSLLNVVALQ